MQCEDLMKLQSPWAFAKILGTVLLFFMVGGGLGSCSSLNELEAFSRCQFRLIEVKEIRAAGVRLSGKSSLKDLSLRDGLRLTQAFVEATSTRANPGTLDFDLVVEALNPNSKTAALERLDWIGSIDDIEIANGKIDHRIEVAGGGGKANFIVPVSVNLDKVLTQVPQQKWIDLLFHLADAGGRPVKVGLKIRPTVAFGPLEFQRPDYIQLNHTFQD